MIAIMLTGLRAFRDGRTTRPPHGDLRPPASVPLPAARHDCAAGSEEREHAAGGRDPARRRDADAARGRPAGGRRTASRADSSSRSSTCCRTCAIVWSRRPRSTRPRPRPRSTRSRRVRRALAVRRRRAARAARSPRRPRRRRRRGRRRCARRWCGRSTLLDALPDDGRGAGARARSPQHLAAQAMRDVAAAEAVAARRRSRRADAC